MNKQMNQQLWLVLVMKAPEEISTGRQQHVPLENNATVAQEVRCYLSLVGVRDIS